MMLIIYKYAFYLLIPFIKLNLIHRIKKGKEEKNRVKELEELIFEIRKNFKDLFYFEIVVFYSLIY